MSLKFYIPEDGIDCQKPTWPPSRMLRSKIVTAGTIDFSTIRFPKILVSRNEQRNNLKEYIISRLNLMIPYFNYISGVVF